MNLRNYNRHFNGFTETYSSTEKRNAQVFKNNLWRDILHNNNKIYYELYRLTHNLWAISDGES